MMEETQKMVPDDDNRERPAEPDQAGSGSANILRIGVVFLAIVSFFTTANGMERYIFTGHAGVAYMSSGAIQMILLALSLNFIGFFRRIMRQKWCWIWRGIVVIFYVILTVVTLFLSSWFSYIYIADVLHANSWDAESELLVQQTYREELYNAQDYLSAYQVYLEERLGDNIALLAAQAREISDTNQGFANNWSTEREVYADSDSLASPYVATVVISMDNAMAPGATQESRDLAVVAISDAEQTIEGRIETLQASVQRQQNSIENYNTQIQNITNRLNNAVEGTDTAALTNALNNYTAMLNSATEQLSALEQENVELENALNWLSRCGNLLGMNDSTSATSIRSSLIQLQTEFYKQDPDVDVLLEIATGVFEDLQRATSSLTDGTQDQTEQYVTLMRQMNGLIQNLQDYSSIKSIEGELDRMVTELSSTGREPDDLEMPVASPEPTTPGEPAAPNEPTTPGEPAAPDEPTTPDEPAAPDEPTTPDEPAVPEEPTTPNEPEAPGETTTPNETAAPDETGAPSPIPTAAPNNDSEEKKDDENAEIPAWISVWRGRLEALKGQIGAMPVYVETSGDSATAGILSNTQREILASYDRNQSNKALDDMLRRYINQHNAVYQGLIYLQSAYRGLAIFALILAFSFDLSGFVFSFAMADDAAKNPEEKKTGGVVLKLPGRTGTRRTEREEWGVVKTAVPYRVLTGDFESEDGIFYYKTFKNGILSRWKVEDKKVYSMGIYAESTQDGGKTGAPLPNEEQELEFANTKRHNGSDAAVYSSGQDGIYRNCGLCYKEGGLLRLVKNQEQTNSNNEAGKAHKSASYDPVYLASVNEYLPIHIYDPSKGESLTMPARNLSRQNIWGKVMVVALNEQKTCVAAVYMLQ